MNIFKEENGVLVELSVQEIADNQQFIDDGYVRQKAGKIILQTESERIKTDSDRLPDKDALKDQLWNACTSYRKLKISEEGMIELKPHESNFTKAGQIRTWIAGLWGSPLDTASADGSYYARKAFIEADGVPSMDFSNFGDLPVTFADAMQEILAG